MAFLRTRRDTPPVQGQLNYALARRGRGAYRARLDLLHCKLADRVPSRMLTSSPFASLASSAYAFRRGLDSRRLIFR